MAPKVEANEVLVKLFKIDPDEAASLITSPLLFGGMMVANGMADALIAGAANETSKVITAGLKTVGLAPGISRLSSYFLMAVPNFMNAGPREFIFADCAVNIDPDDAQYRNIFAPERLPVTCDCRYRNRG